MKVIQTCETSCFLMKVHFNILQPKDEILQASTFRNVHRSILTTVYDQSSSIPCIYVEYILDMT
jgi:hypothetical protein